MISFHSRMPSGLDWKSVVLRLWRALTLHLQAAAAAVQAMPTAYYCTYDPMMSSSIWILGCMTSVCLMLQVPPGSEYAERREELETALNVLTSCLSGFSNFWDISKKMLGKIHFHTSICSY